MLFNIIEKHKKKGKKKGNENGITNKAGRVKEEHTSFISITKFHAIRSRCSKTNSTCHVRVRNFYVIDSHVIDGLI